MRSVLLALTLSLPPAALVAQPLPLQDLIDKQQSDPMFRAGEADLRQLRFLLASTSAPAPKSGAGAQTRSGKWSQASYVWDSEALLDPDRREAELQALRKAGMDKIYLGLKAAQINDLVTTRRRLEQLLQDAAREDLQVSLLLGDSSWIEPTDRHQLSDLLRKLKGLAFSSLHLDLEVEQLGMPVPDQRLKNWLDTLRMASNESPWPVEISSHHRWFAEPKPGQTCVPCGLPEAGVRQVSLMIYTRNPQNSARMTEQIAKRWPALQFRLAQSTEPELPATESWAGASTEQLKNQASAWREQLQPRGVAGIDWQAWRDFPKR